MILKEPNNTAITLNGLVLIGGKSTRMNQDKGLLIYHGCPQREYVFELLSKYCAQTFMSCNAQQKEELQGLPLIEDNYTGIGPAGGILSAFEFAPHAAWLVVACDLPYLSHNTVSYLICHRNPAKAATAFMNALRTFPEPLATVWEPVSYSLLLRNVNEGRLCPRKTLMNADIELLEAPDVTELENVNTPREREKAMRWFGQS